MDLKIYLRISGLSQQTVICVMKKHRIYKFHVEKIWFQSYYYEVQRS